MAGERTLPGLGLTAFWDEGSDGWKTKMDENIRTLSALVAGGVKSRTSTLPVSPVNGDIYIVQIAGGPNANKVALRDNGAWVYLAPAEGWRMWVQDTDELVIWDGAAWVVHLPPYIFAFFFGPTPSASEILNIHVAGRAFTLGANLAGLLSDVGINPTASFALDVLKNGTTIATITVSTGGVVSATTVGGTAKSIAAGDVLKIVGPASADSTAANMAFTMIGV